VQVPGPPAAGSGAADIPGFGQPTWQPLELQHVVEVGRPQGLPPGSEVRVPLLVSLGPGLPLQPGRHVWEIEIDGRRETRWQVGFLVSLPQQPSVPEQQV
jgi:hypothetical protein